MYYKGVINKKLLLKVTSRGRVAELKKAVQTYIDLADNPKELKFLFTFDVDDSAYNNKNFIDELSELIPGCYIAFGHSENKIHAINRDIETYSKLYEWDIIANLSDDQLAVKQGWDTIIRETMPNHLDASLFFQDGRQDRLNTMEILGRKYYERFNYIYYPEYKSFFCDNEAHEVAEKLGKLIKSKECLFSHFHISWAEKTHMTHDETYKRAEKNWGHDEQLYKRRKQINFGL